MSMKSAELYRERFKRVFDFIDRHLDEHLTVNRLSQVANFSLYHFHRQFSEYSGLSVSRYIQLMRLRRASYQLVFSTRRRIIDISLDAGFENPESFSRAFKRCFGQTPSQFRSDPVWEPWNEKMQLPVHKECGAMNVDIVDFPDSWIAVLEHRGDPNLVNDSVMQFITWRKSTGLSPVTTSHTFGIAYDDPQTTPSDEYRLDICGSVSQQVAENPQGVVNKIIPSGLCAVLRQATSAPLIASPTALTTFIVSGYQ